MYFFFPHLKYVGEVSQVKDVVELDGSGEEGGGDALVQSQGELDQGGAALLEDGAEALASQVLRQDGGVNGAQGLGAGKRQGEDGEVALRRHRQGRERVSYIPDRKRGWGSGGWGGGVGGASPFGSVQETVKSVFEFQYDPP